MDFEPNRGSRLILFVITKSFITSHFLNSRANSASTITIACALTLLEPSSPTGVPYTLHQVFCHNLLHISYICTARFGRRDRAWLCHICNEVLSSGIFPTRLKYAVIQPILNIGVICLIIDTSLLPSFSKVFEGFP